MKIPLLILGFLCMCKSTLAQLDSITIEPKKITFHNWQTTHTNAAIFLLDETEKIQIQGNFQKVKNKLIFMPEFPLVENAVYVFLFEGSQKEFSLPKTNTKLPKVTAVYPTANQLPENILRMYIQFSQPMKTVDNLQHIKLIDENGEEVKGAIFNNVYELWNDAQTQLTIIFDPARVKTGLIANETLGRALTPHKTFKLVIQDLEDIYGQKLLGSYTKTFSVLPVDVKSPNVALWKIEVPLKESKKPLKIDFFNTIDHMSLCTRIQVYTTDNELVEGKIQIENQEKALSFTPNRYWEKGKYIIKVNSRLADPSGNNLNGLFDHKIGSLKNIQEGEIVVLKFSVE